MTTQTTAAHLDPCERCGYVLDFDTHDGICPVCALDMAEDVWPCDREDWEAFHCFPGEQPYPEPEQVDAWRTEAVRRMNVEQGRQPLLFETGGGA